jgi:SAM-dependent methyltransferase
MSAVAGDREGRAGTAGTGRRCPLCGGAARRALLARDLNRAASAERFEYSVCGSCGTYFLLDPPADLSPFYPGEYYNLPAAEALDALAAGERANVERLLAHTGTGRLVEIGPGEGVFARAAHNAGFAVTAIEMDGRACEHLRAAAGVEAIESASPEEVLATLPPSRAIVMRHVIEHLREPWRVLDRAAENLQEGGVLMISTPNPRALQFRLLGRRWAHLDAPRHLFLIPSQTLARRCSELGLRLAASTTVDADGLHWNRFGWEYALRRAPRSRPEASVSRRLSGPIARALAPLERRGENGCAYTSIFVKASGGG